MKDMLPDRMAFTMSSELWNDNSAYAREQLLDEGFVKSVTAHGRYKTIFKEAEVR